jgi:5S rRNA maturation endonuclease (ribonuclease M5)
VSDAYDLVCQRLVDVTGFDPSGNGLGTYRCPAHPDRKPSLSVTDADDRVLVRCQAGCETEAVLNALGLQWGDLFDGTPSQAPSNEREIADIYDYTDEDGTLLSQVVRYRPKAFRQRRPSSDGGWDWSLGNNRRVLYRLPKVREAVASGYTVFIVEGEKDVHALERAGEIATCNPGGAGKWRPEFVEMLRGAAEVVIVADKDAPGYRHAAHVARTLAGAVEHVLVVEARGNAKDAAEHLAAGHTADELDNITDDIGRLAGLSSGTSVRPVRPDRAADSRIQDLSQFDDNPSWPTLSLAAFHGLPGDIVRAIMPFTEADPAAMLTSALVAFGNAVGSGPAAIADAASHPARLFICVVGKTAKARKGTSWRNVARIFDVADPGWRADRVKSGLSTGEGLIAAVADPVSDADGKTVVPGNADKRLLVVEEEFSRMLQVAKREGTTLSAVVRQAYDSGDLSVLTKQPQRATGAHISIIGHITREELRARLTETEMANGLANRFLFVCAQRSKVLPDAPQIDEATINRLGARVAHALSKARTLSTMGWSDQARQRWRELYQAMADDDPGGLFGCIVARPEAHTLRLAVTYALMDSVGTIDVPHLEAAWAVWQYCRQSAAHIFGDAVGDEHADKLVRAIREAGADGLDGTAQSALFTGHLGKKQLDRLRARLGERIVTQTEQTGGHPRLVSYDARLQHGWPG